MYRVLLLVFGMLPKRVQEIAEWLLSTKTTLGVGVAAFDNEGRVLMFQHRYQPRDSWQLPGGHAHARERPEAALLRELAEEGGAGVELGELVYVDVSTRWPARTSLFYAARLKSLPQHVTPEVTGWKLWPSAALPAGVDEKNRRAIDAARAAGYANAGEP